jgi:hypothetical protein
MARLYVLTLFVFVFSTSFAQIETNDKIFVQSFDSDIDLSSLNNTAYDKKTAAELSEKSLVNELPSSTKLAKIIRESELEIETKNFDQMDLDILCLKAIQQDFASLKKKYPTIASHKLKKLITLLRNKHD